VPHGHPGGSPEADVIRRDADGRHAEDHCTPCVDADAGAWLAATRAEARERRRVDECTSRVRAKPRKGHSEQNAEHTGGRETRVRYMNRHSCVAGAGGGDRYERERQKQATPSGTSPGACERSAAGSPAKWGAVRIAQSLEATMPCSAG
jgi:hypothetical protein